jgi:hypothetical protein
MRPWFRVTIEPDDRFGWCATVTTDTWRHYQRWGPLANVLEAVTTFVNGLPEEDEES